MITVSDLELNGVKHIRLKRFVDERGFFEEHFRAPLYASFGIKTSFVQVNHSFSVEGVIRGLHFQSTPGQAKLISVIQGRIYDVFVDVRPESETFGKWQAVVLDADNHEQLFIPAGFAHGFAVLSETAHLVYQVSSLFDPRTEMTIRYDDPTIGIAWPFESPILSEKDRDADDFQTVLDLVSSQ